MVPSHQGRPTRRPAVFGHAKLGEEAHMDVYTPFSEENMATGHDAVLVFVRCDDTVMAAIEADVAQCLVLPIDHTTQMYDINASQPSNINRVRSFLNARGIENQHLSELAGLKDGLFVRKIIDILHDLKGDTNKMPHMKRYFGAYNGEE
jgi:hypothetical protein